MGNTTVVYDNESLNEANELLKKANNIKRSKPKEAQKLLIQALSKTRNVRPPTDNSILLQIDIISEDAHICFELNDFERAGNYFRAAFTNIKVHEWKKEPPKKYLRMYKYAIQASEQYVMTESYGKASNVLLQAGKVTIDHDVDLAIELFDKACDIMETNDKPQESHKYFDMAVKYTLKGKKYTKVIELLERDIKQYETKLQERIARIWRNVCEIMLVYFHLKHIKSGQNRYNDALKLYQKISKDVPQMKLAEKFLHIFVKCDQKAFDDIIKSGDIGNYLHATFSPFVKNLNLKDVKSQE